MEAHASFTRQLAVETAECNAERLKRAQWVRIVHGEDVIGDTTELQHDVVG